jgi:beta-hydroxylase
MFGSNERLGPEIDPNDPKLAELTAEQKDYFKRIGNSTFNHKDRWGVLLVFLIIVVLLMCLKIVMLGIDFTSITQLLGTVGLIVGIIAWEPIRVMYIGSSLFAIFLRTPEFMDRTFQFPNHKLFEDPKTYKAIQEEVRTYVERVNGGKGLISTKDTFDGENDYIGSGGDGDKQWRIQLIKMLDVYAKDIESQLPNLCKSLDQSPEIVSCVLSVLDPGVKIPMHVGYYKGLMRYMLPITVPKDRDNIWLNVNGLKYTWTEGDGILWDDTYPHAVYNRTNEKRIVLYMDVLRETNMPYYAKLVNKFTVRILKAAKLAETEIAKTEVVVKI